MFSDEERRIFTARVRDRVIRDDPLAVRRSFLKLSGGKFYSWLDSSEEPQEPAADASEEVQAIYALDLLAALTAQEKVVACARDVFGLPAPDFETGTGYTEREVWEAVGQYLEYLEKNERSGGS